MYVPHCVLKVCRQRTLKKVERCFLRIRLNAHHPTVTIAAELCDLALLYSNGRVQQLGWGFKELQKDLQDFNLQKGLRDVLYLNKMVSVVLEFLVIFVTSD